MKNPAGRTPIEEAIRHGKLEIFSTLLKEQNVKIPYLLPRLLSSDICGNCTESCSKNDEKICEDCESKIKECLYKKQKIEEKIVESSYHGVFWLQTLKYKMPHPIISEILQNKTDMADQIKNMDKPSWLEKFIKDEEHQNKADIADRIKNMNKSPWSEKSIQDKELFIYSNKLTEIMFQIIDTGNVEGLKLFLKEKEEYINWSTKTTFNLNALEYAAARLSQGMVKTIFETGKLTISNSPQLPYAIAYAIINDPYIPYPYYNFLQFFKSQGIDMSTIKVDNFMEDKRSPEEIIRDYEFEERIMFCTNYIKKQKTIIFLEDLKDFAETLSKTAPDSLNCTKTPDNKTICHSKTPIMPTDDTDYPDLNLQLDFET